MNIDVVARVRASERGEPPANLQIDKFNVVKCGRLPFTFAHLHKSEAGVCEIFSKSIEPLLDLCITGFNTCLLIVGESDAGKEKLLMGDETVRNGLLPILFASLFAKIGDDDVYTSVHRPSDGRRLDRVQMQMVEIRGEESIDLFNTTDNSQSLHLIERADAGVRIENLTTTNIRNVGEGSDVLKSACHRSGGLQESAIIVYIHLTLEPHEKSQPNHSWFSIVMLPGSESLPMNINIDIKDVPTSQKFMYRLLQYVHEMSIRRSPETIIKRPDSTLVALLTDELGGNCKTRVFVFLKNFHDTSKIDALFRFLTDLSHIKNYPILNDAFALQLIKQYRAEIMTLRGRNDFSAELLQLRVENVDLRDAYEGLLSKTDQCRRRIDALEKDKLDMSDQVLVVEEEKLKLSKMLVELQIDNNKLKEECEATKFELGNRIIQLENENMECHMKAENSRRTIDTLNARNRELETDLRDVTQEFTVLKTNYTVLMKGYEDELAHCDEITAELLSLASTKAELIRNIASLSQKVDSSNPDADLKHARNMVGNRPSTRIKITEMSQTTRERGDYSCATTEKRHKAEMERQKQAFIDNERILEAKIGNLTKVLNETRDVARAKYSILAELNARVLTLTDQKNTLESQNNRLQHKLKAVNEDFRARLIKFVEDAALFIDRQKTDESDIKGGSCQKMEPYVNEMLGDLKHAYHVREEQLSSVAQDCRAQMQNVIRKHEALVTAYRELKIQVSDLGISEIDLGPDEKDLMLTDTELQSIQHKEINRLRKNLNQSEQEREQLEMKTWPETKTANPYPGNNMNNCVEATSPQSWAVLQKQLKEFTLNTQQELESERAGLLSRNAMLEQEVTELNDYINSDLKRYKNEIARLQGLLAAPRGKKLH